MTIDESPVREYPRTPFRGPVRVWFSERMWAEGRYPKFHYYRDCDGLERTPRGKQSSITFESAFALGVNLDGRPCRMCTLERVLYTVLRPRAQGNFGGKMVFTTFTSQSCPTSPDQRIQRYKWKESSPTGQERLRRIAATLKLPTTSAPCGPVAWGFLPHAGARILELNLRTEVRLEVVELPSADVIECAWALLDDRPPQLRQIYGDDGAPDPWDLAQALLG